MWKLPQVPGKMTQTRGSFEWHSYKMMSLCVCVCDTVQWKGVSQICVCRCWQKGQTKVTTDTPSSYCTITDNFLSNEPRMYFWFLRHFSFQQKRQWVRFRQVHRFIQKKTLCCNLDLTFSFTVSSDSLNTEFESHGFKIHWFNCCVNLSAVKSIYPGNLFENTDSSDLQVPQKLHIHCMLVSFSNFIHCNFV